MPKPFIAARIPEAIDKAIFEKTEETGESKTDILLNALRAYLGGHITTPKSTDKRISELENKVIQIEKELRANPKHIQENLFDNASDDNIDNKENMVETKDSTEEEQKGEWTTKQLEAVGINRSTVETRLIKKQLPYTKNGVTVNKRIRKEKKGKYTVSIWEVSKEV